ncbi:MAG: MlaA family lipoprotein [Sulfuricaulis sp.]
MSSIIISPHYIHRLLLGGLCMLALSACSTMQNRPMADASSPAATDVKDAGVNGDAAAEQYNAHDPFEGFNRAMYAFNDKLDRYVLKPVAKGYRAVTPAPVRASVANFFSNLHDPVVMVNNLLQGKPGPAASDLGRFMFNSTIGVFGLFDVSSKFGLPKHDEDFGLTLAAWGVGDGPYLVLPFFGPSNMRDAPSLAVDWEMYPLSHVKDSGTRDKLLLLEIVDKRSQLLEASDILEQAGGQDPYIFVREAYRQRRRNQVYGDNPPPQAPPAFLFEDDTPAPKGPAKPARGADGTQSK